MIKKRTILYLTGFLLIVAGLVFVVWYFQLGEKQNKNLDERAENKSDENLKVQMARLTLTASFHNFGRISQEEKVKHTFELLNTGEKDLVIKDLKTS